MEKKTYQFEHVEIKECELCRFQRTSALCLFTGEMTPLAGKRADCPLIDVTNSKKEATKQVQEGDFRAVLEKSTIRKEAKRLHSLTRSAYFSNSLRAYTLSEKTMGSVCAFLRALSEDDTLHVTGKKSELVFNRIVDMCMEAVKKSTSSGDNGEYIYTNSVGPFALKILSELRSASEEVSKSGQQ